MDDPKHPNPDVELPPPPEEKLITAHASDAANNSINNAAGTGSKQSKWKLVIMGIILVIIFEAVSIYFLKTENDIKFFQSFLGITPTQNITPTSVPTLVPQPSPTTIPNPTDSKESSTKSGTMCTMDAMQCPDGSYVGRTGPDCKFVCPKGITQ